MGLHKFFHHSAVVSCITFHIWKSVDCYFSNKVYRDILRNSYVLTKTLKCLCTLYLKNSNLQIFVHEKLCMKLQLNDEKTCVDPWSHIYTFEGWTVLTETIVLGTILKALSSSFICAIVWSLDQLRLLPRALRSDPSFFILYPGQGRRNHRAVFSLSDSSMNRNETISFKRPWTIIFDPSVF